MRILLVFLQASSSGATHDFRVGYRVLHDISLLAASPPALKRLVDAINILSLVNDFDYSLVLAIMGWKIVKDLNAKPVFSIPEAR